MIKDKLRKAYRILKEKYDFIILIELWRNNKKYPIKVLSNSTNEYDFTIHFIHRYLTNNTGDLACGYYQYFYEDFKNYNCLIHDINGVKFSLIKKNDIIIVGGGGLLNASPEWNYTLNRASSLAKKSIIWSAGFNSSKGLNSLNLNSFSLISVRDYLYKGIRCVPCATCMIPSLSRDYQIKRKYGVLAHKDVLSHIPSEFSEYDFITNEVTIDQMIEFIGTSEVVLTNSYHAVYWSTLLNRISVLFAPRSEKYNYFKYPPTLYSGNLNLDVSRSKLYPDALKESKKLTLDFVADIRNLILT